MVDCEAVLVTLSEHGMTLVARGRPGRACAVVPVKVLDVSGAGDTVVATLAAFLASGRRLRGGDARRERGGRRRGRQARHRDRIGSELRARILPAAALAPEQKIVTDWSALDQRLAAWRADELRIGFTNGCFDLLHPGHVKLLAEARAACDRLVVGLNSDASVQRLKGDGRPVQHEVARAEVLAALAAVDLVVLFERGHAARIDPRACGRRCWSRARTIGPDQVVGREVVEAGGGEVILVGLVPGHSTSALVARSRAAWTEH